MWCPFLPDNFQRYVTFVFCLSEYSITTIITVVVYIDNYLNNRLMQLPVSSTIQYYCLLPKLPESGVVLEDSLNFHHRIAFLTPARKTRSCKISKTDYCIRRSLLTISLGLRPHFSQIIIQTAEKHPSDLHLFFNLGTQNMC